MSMQDLGGSSDPRKRFIADLCQAINEAQMRGDEVIVGLDANAVIGEDPQGLDKLIREGGLYDLAYNIPEITGDPPGMYEILG